jgi:Cu(I)/Ag(I) efflux system membrane protein CusA/SilA
MGLVPIMYSTGSGADVMKRIAAPMLGGVGSALVLVLLVFPAIFSIWREGSVDRGEYPGAD